MRLPYLLLVLIGSCLSSGASAEVVYACVDDKKGTLSLVSDLAECNPDKETAVSWEVADPAAPRPRFEDCGDGTVADHRTGLQWEKKTGTPSGTGGGRDCETLNCSDPHDVNNRYLWSDTGKDPDGGVFSDFLEKVNDLQGLSDCLGGHCDWRLPVPGELRTIMIGIDAAPGQSTDPCSSAPCVDPDFASVGGPTLPFGFYLSADTRATNFGEVWGGNFNNGTVWVIQKYFTAAVRAVRGGSCE